MDEFQPGERWLQINYARLFEVYGAGANDPVLNAKERISDFVSEYRGVLRPDAAYFLLLNSDHMIIRPNAGYVPGIDLSQAPEGWPQSDISERVDQSLNLIFDVLLSEERYNVSAHEMMLVVDQNWTALADIVFWP